MNSSTKQSQIAVTTSGTILQTVATPTWKLLAMVQKESLVVRYLKEREKIKNKINIVINADCKSILANINVSYWCL